MELCKRDVADWHKANIAGQLLNVRFRGNSGHADLSFYEYTPWYGGSHAACLDLLIDVIVREYAQRGALDVIVLAAFQRPQERSQPDQAESKRHWHQIKKYVHAIFSFGTHVCARVSARLILSGSRARKAFRVTRSEEPDMAAAAISGVTRPAIAIGTATAL